MPFLRFKGNAQTFQKRFVSREFTRAAFSPANRAPPPQPPLVKMAARLRSVYSRAASSVSLWKRDRCHLQELHPTGSLRSTFECYFIFVFNILKYNLFLFLLFACPILENEISWRSSSLCLPLFSGVDQDTIRSFIRDRLVQSNCFLCSLCAVWRSQRQLHSGPLMSVGRNTKEPAGLSGLSPR